MGKKRKVNMWYNTTRKIKGEMRKVRVRRLSNGKEQIQILHPKRKSLSERLAKINISEAQDYIGSEISDERGGKIDYFHVRRQFGYDGKEKKELSKDLKNLEDQGLIEKQMEKSDYEATLKLSPLGKKYF